MCAQNSHTPGVALSVRLRTPALRRTPLSVITLQADAPPPHVRVRTLHVSFSALFLLLNLIPSPSVQRLVPLLVNKSPT